MHLWFIIYWLCASLIYRWGVNSIVVVLVWKVVKNRQSSLEENEQMNNVLLCNLQEFTDARLSNSRWVRPCSAKGWPRKSEILYMSNRWTDWDVIVMEASRMPLMYRYCRQHLVWAATKPAWWRWCVGYSFSSAGALTRLCMFFSVCASYTYNSWYLVVKICTYKSSQSDMSYRIHSWSHKWQSDCSFSLNKKDIPSIGMKTYNTKI